jgi:hypothetical protein
MLLLSREMSVRQYIFAYHFPLLIPTISFFPYLCYFLHLYFHELANDIKSRQTDSFKADWLLRTVFGL